MAQTLKTGLPVRGVEAIVERPDGSRAFFEPYPTPLFDDKGRLTGAVNMLVDITERKQLERSQAHLSAIVESLGRCHSQQKSRRYNPELEQKR